MFPINMAFLHEICTKDYCPTSVPLNAVTYAIISHQTVCKRILKLQANRNMANIVLELDPNPAKKKCSLFSDQLNEVGRQAARVASMFPMLFKNVQC